MHEASEGNAMDCSTGRTRWILAAALLATIAIASQSGCTNMLATMAWVIQGGEVPPEFTGLRNKNVAVVCRPLVDLEYSNSRSAEEIAKQVGKLLEARVRKVRVVDPRQVAQWTDEHDWNDFAEVGKALKADLVLGIDLGEFSLYQGQTLYQGKARIVLTVYDVAQNGKIVYQKKLPPTVYPPNVAIPTAERQEDQFRQLFISVLSDEIGRHFYAHDARADFARDSKTLSEG
jgi:hypothetical protein